MLIQMRHSLANKVISKNKFFYYYHSARLIRDDIVKLIHSHMRYMYICVGR